MPNLDAEVLNEPKKQIVKDFNKEEIVQIIQNAIDKRILDLGDIGGGSGESLDINLANYCTNEQLVALIGCVTGDAPSYPAGNVITFSDEIAIDYDKVDKVTLQCEIQTGDNSTLSAKVVLYKSSLVRATGEGLTVELRGYFGSIAFSDTKKIVSYLQLGTSVQSDNKFDHLEYVSTVPEEVVPVVANPEVDGSESPLTGLQVGDTKYAVGGGSGSHCYKISCSGMTLTYFYYYTDNDDITDNNSLKNDMIAKNYNSNVQGYAICNTAALSGGGWDGNACLLLENFWVYNNSSFRGSCFAFGTQNGSFVLTRDYSKTLTISNITKIF